MANNLEERLNALKGKQDNVGDQFGSDDIRTLVEGIEYAMSHGGTVGVTFTALEDGSGYKITITDSEGVAHEATLKNGGDAYEVYKSTVPSGQNQMSREEWLASLKGADGADGQDGQDGQDGADGADAVNPFKGYYPSGVSKPDTGAVGDYLYAPPSDQTSSATATIWHYDSTQTPPWTDTIIDVSAVVAVEFGSGQSVPSTKIKDESGKEITGPADVMSAETGKLIVETTMELIHGENLLNPAEIDTENRLDNDGKLRAKGTYTQVYGVTDYIEIGNDGIICTHCTKVVGVVVVSVCVYDNNKLFIGFINCKSDGKPGVITKDTSLNGTPAAGADTTNPTYAKFSLYNPESMEGGVAYDGETDGYAVYRGTTLPQSFVPYVAPHWEQKKVDIEDNAITTPKIANAAITIDKMYDVVEEYVSDNILNPANCVFELGKYVDYRNGRIGTSTSTTSSANGYTEYIPIDERGIVFNHGVGAGKTIGTAVYYIDGEGNKVFKRGIFGNNRIIAVNFDSGDQSLPDSDPGHYPDAFVRFTISRNGDATNVMCNIGTTLKEYVPYGGIKQVLSPNILPNGENTEQVLQQKKIYTDALRVALPDKFYAVRGDVLQLFHKGVVYAIDFANRYAMPTCSKGTQFRRYYELDATKVVFTVPSTANAEEGAVYTTQGNTYEVTKVVSDGSTKSVTCTFKGAATITSSGTLTKISGNGDSSISYTKFTDTVAAGEFSYKLTIYDDNRNILGEGSSMIKLVNFPTAPQSTKRILCIGASTTAGGQWVCEAQRRLLGVGVNPTYENSPKGDGLDDTKIKFIGSLSKELYGQTSHFFAKSGWSWEDFATSGRYAIRFYLEGNNRVSIGTKYTNNGHTYEVIELNTIDGVETIRCSTASGNTPSPHGDNVNGTLTLSSGDGDATLTYIKSEVDGANPFWNQTQLDFQNYIETICGETGLDMMIIVLGSNAMFSTSLEQQEEYVRAFVEACHADYPDCKIILVGSSSPSMINMLPGYGVGGNSFGNTYLVKCRLLDVFEMYKSVAADHEYVEFESWAGQFDTDYNYPLTQKAVNTRNDSVTEPYANNTIHPGNAGYMQFADAAYRSIVAHLCQPNE